MATTEAAAGRGVLVDEGMKQKKLITIKSPRGWTRWLL